MTYHRVRAVVYVALLVVSSLRWPVVAVSVTEQIAQLNKLVAESQVMIINVILISSMVLQFTMHANHMYC